MEHASTLLKLPKSGYHVYWMRPLLLDTPEKFELGWGSNCNLTIHFTWWTIGKLFCERTFEQHLLEDDRAEIHVWERLYLHGKHGLCLLVFTDDIDIAAKKKRLLQVRAIPRKKVDLKGPASLIDHVYLRCTQPGAQIKNRIVVDKQVVEMTYHQQLGDVQVHRKKRRSRFLFFGATLCVVMR